MKQILAAVAVAALVAAGVSFAAVRWLAQRHAAVEPVSIHEVDWLTRELGLSEAQAARLQTLEVDYRGRIGSCCRAHCGARYALSEELAKTDVDMAKARECVEKMCAAQVESEQATLEHILKVREVLTPEQQMKYAQLINRQLCTACPLGAHTPQ